MKLRLLALSAVLLTLSYATPRSWAQDQGTSAPPAPPASDSVPKIAAPAPVNPADPDKVRHDGGKEDAKIASAAAAMFLDMVEKFSKSR